MKGAVDLDKYLPFTSIMGEVGRIVVSKEIRDKLNIKPGTIVSGFIRVPK